MVQIPSMQTSTLPPAVLAEMHDACQAEPALLNSERIERQFGSCGIAVLPSEAGLRRSSVYSVQDDEQVCRTYAIVRFAEQPEEWYREEHAKILAGNSIGAVFRSHGWEVRKQTLYIGSLPLPDSRAAICELMQLPVPGKLALHVYQLLLVRDTQAFEYATIIEAHHPDYLSENALRDLYKYDPATALSPNAVAELAALVPVTAE